jgi:hypothetical protein
LALSSPRFGHLAKSRWFSAVGVCGKHSLEIFSFGTLLALGGRLLLSMFGASWSMQVAVNAIGLGGMFVAVRTLEMMRKDRSGRRHATVSHAPAS